MGYKILNKTQLSENLYEIVVDAPYVVKNAKAGQFIILRVEENGERIPLTIADVDKEQNKLTIVYMAVGLTTKKLAQLNAGDEILDLVGPLGLPTDIENYGTVVCVAGGYGAAPAYLISKAYKEAGNKVYMIVGTRTEALVFWEDKMKTACDKLFITTDDGSKGRKGLVTDQLREIMGSEPVNHVMAIGPIPMMRAVAELTRDKQIPTTVSMNPIMVDGTGMCGSCRLTVDGNVKFACVDGPDFDGHKVDFHEIIMRSKVYKDHEHAANHQCNLVNQAVK
jgi:ferredoxin--NADP+ reductase